MGARIRSWFGSVRSSTSRLTEDQVGMRHRSSWRLTSCAMARAVMSSLFLDLGAEGIERIDLLCSGFLAEPGVGQPDAGFDAATWLRRRPGSGCPAPIAKVSIANRWRSS